MRSKRILVAGVGNVLRGDDGFGPAVTELLGHLPAGAEVVETGTGGSRCCRSSWSAATASC